MTATVVHVREREIFGFSARTNNENEMNPGAGKIPGLVEKFDTSTSVNYQEGARVYSVYYDYETDASGCYSVLVGADDIESSTGELASVKIKEGNYLVFSARGQVPQILFETWSEIWNYFSRQDCPYSRAFTTDFEFYKNQNHIEIHIAIK